MKKHFKYYWSIFIKPHLWWILWILISRDHQLIVFFYACFILYLAITTIGNPKAIYYKLTKENAKKEEKKLKPIIEIVLIVLSSCIIYAAIDVLRGCDEIYDILVLVLVGIILPLVLFIGLSIKRRRWFQKNIDAPIHTLEDVFNYMDSLVTEEKDSTYVRLKSFDTLEDAEDLKKRLEDNGIPSMIYGANKIGYISREVLPIQVMVTKKHLTDAQRFI